MGAESVDVFLDISEYQQASKFENLRDDEKPKEG